MGRKVVLLLSSLLIVLLVQVDSQATSCVSYEYRFKDIREVASYAEEAIHVSFNIGFLFGICFSIIVVTLCVLLRNRRYLISVVYGVFTFFLFIGLLFANGMSSACLSPGMDPFYLQIATLTLALCLIGSLVLAKRRIRPYEPNIIDLSGE